VSRSHPPTLLTLAERTLRRECGLSRGEGILIAVSGGPDSQALLHVLARLGPRLGLQIFAHGVDHGLRPEAGSELELARRLARSLGVPFTASRVELAPGGNLMARAREARYRALGQQAERRGAAFIATAHHADDRAETLLMRLLRGTSVAGLGVLPPRSGNRLRPFVRARRRDVLAHLGRHEVPYAVDPSNSDRRFLRVRVRLEVLPSLEELSPAIVDNLTALADEIALGPVPALSDAGGAPIALGRAQRRALRELAATRSRRARVLLPGGRQARFEAGRGLVVEPAAQSGRSAGAPKKSGRNSPGG
jgi:tRNA(Ile)-lysidine synthase